MCLYACLYNTHILNMLMFSFVHIPFSHRATANCQVNSSYSNSYTRQIWPWFTLINRQIWNDSIFTDSPDLYFNLSLLHSCFCYYFLLLSVYSLFLAYSFSSHSSRKKFWEESDSLIEQRNTPVPFYCHCLYFVFVLGPDRWRPPDETELSLS